MVSRNCTKGCSSRTTPKPRPPAAPTPRPNITFHTYECPPEYAAWYCLNGATCFTVKIGNSLIYNCECVESFVGPRCEYKDLDGSYLPSQRKYMLETASIAGGATIAVLSVVMICAAAYLHYRRKAKRARAAQGGDCVDSAPRRHQPTFGTRWRTTTSNGGGGGPPRPGHPHHTFPPPNTTTQTGAAVEQDRGGGDTPGQGSGASKAEELRQVTALLQPPPPSATANAPPPDAAAQAQATAAAAAGEP
ncbi:unnamed protein product [Acanthoscelides obtectus]|uniref:EGF-like domain-containing protein n=1 Tax=Acanthoscelides obtectus TaxID=200917 RepID=A0A9P0JRA7_ACAOB|nr:unnamed protein product [Acanthoscelides obtectus]CAK1668001.1 Protein spitz [Acanthoscelides obtectus]